MHGWKSSRVARGFAASTTPRLVIATGHGKFCATPEAQPDSSIASVLTAEEMFRQHTDLLTEMARKYLWWMPPEEAPDYPRA